MAQGEFALVTELLKRALHKPSGYISNHDVYAMLADAAVQQRDKDALREYAPLLEEAAASLEHKLYLAIAYRAWGVLYRLEGQFVKAETRLKQASDLFSGLGTHWQLGRTHFELAELAADSTETAKAAQHYAKAVELFEEMGALPDAVRANEGLKKF